MNKDVETLLVLSNQIDLVLNSDLVKGSRKDFASNETSQEFTIGVIHEILSITSHLSMGMSLTNETLKKELPILNKYYKDLLDSEHPFNAYKAYDVLTKELTDLNMKIKSILKI